ncbi:Spermidine/putrescine import ATP-binding protein PotA [Geodia barretti]|uniref:Spermidine/putrescine import ATP-binding protein PotA n=1 Tax=Geodia barretti TaxID=519541 RepID=A0AA35X4M3_GEOBA|nr:Spermidine/putrescine import ATP-binding protein PotA [Geodia barretti]
MRLEVRQEVEAILRSKGVATIFVTHDREEAFAFADRVGVMSGGRLEQIDAPYALYQAPVSPEVARIVGDCDFLQGVVRGNVAETELGSLPYTCGEGKLADGTVLTLVVRPQDLKPESDDAGICCVEALEYRGGDTMLAVRTPSGTALRCRLPRYSGFSKGEQITLTPVDSTPFIAFMRPTDRGINMARAKANIKSKSDNLPPSRQRLSMTAENYLLSIYRLDEEDALVTLTQLAEHLKVLPEGEGLGTSLPTVGGMIRRLT